MLPVLSARRAFSLFLSGLFLHLSIPMPQVCCIQVPLRTDQPFSSSASSAHGRFLHITDLHPDPFYLSGGSVEAGCHEKKPKGGRRAGAWGTPISDCDSPPHLIEASLDWLAHNFMPTSSSTSRGERASEVSARHDEADGGRGVDFIIWTGDSARHDLDSGHPRTRSEIYELNRWAVGVLEKRFPGVPLVPTIGNNDIFPHNILFAGPNDVTRSYLSIWTDHIPEDQSHTFFVGGYYSKEVLPSQNLWVLSLNTLWWYDSNRAVDGCKRSKKGKKDQGDPGSRHLDWLEAQLGMLRKRGAAVHLIGHVPPTAGNYFPRCYDRYTDIVLRFQDTIVGQHYGHMNVDGLFIQEDSSANSDAMSQRDDALTPARLGILVERRAEEHGNTTRDEEVHVQSLSADLRHDFKTLPGEARTDLDLYHAFFAAPSIVPTFWPAVRVWTYNVTRARHGSLQNLSSTEREVEDVGRQIIELRSAQAMGAESDADELAEADLFGERHEGAPLHTAKRKHRRKKHRRHKNLPRHVSPSSPSRSNGRFSLLGYSQWICDLDAANEREADMDAMHWESASRKKSDGLQFYLEYATYQPETLWAELLQQSDSSALERGTSKPQGNHAHPSESSAAKHIPVPKHLLQAELKRLKSDPPRWIHGRYHSSESDQLNGGSEMSKHRKLHMPKRLKHLTDWDLPSLTIPDLLQFGRRLASDKKLWKRYRRRIYADSGALD
ncbi:Acid sphingomyelinase and PHM5 phosphate metabolism protein [Ceraceosorus bombacis]|uniref:Acid sphingomyelinase and PHM5 phosphate metabolism protein n=1 Tax=Ceraceosorus bombacis TaxID=401625 RepID=A0A0P1B921_9BASI|nr:Acid sphingomyelinase and PHM5 phosphate metabolism protein [Ceraceosorus bombacis]